MYINTCHRRRLRLLQRQEHGRASRRWAIPRTWVGSTGWTNIEGYSWTAHGRYPTNTPGWWGGAHPFALLDYSVVHNGEISSYDANRRFIEMYGYHCALADGHRGNHLHHRLPPPPARSDPGRDRAASLPPPSGAPSTEMSDRRNGQQLTYLRNALLQPAGHRPLLHSCWALRAA